MWFFLEEHLFEVGEQHKKFFSWFCVCPGGGCRKERSRPVIVTSPLEHPSVTLVEELGVPPTLKSTKSDGMSSYISSHPQSLFRTFVCICDENVFWHLDHGDFFGPIQS